MIKKINYVFKEAFILFFGAMDFRKRMSRIKIKQKINPNTILTLSNVLTAIRVFLVPFIVGGLLYQKWILALVLFLIASVSDLLDGHLAREWGQKTYFGEILDPIADKILLLSTFIALFYIGRTVSSVNIVLPIWFLFVVIAREVVMGIGSIILFLIGKKIEIHPTIWGRLTTLFQTIFIFWYVICLFFGWVPLRTYYLVILLLAVFSLFSLIHYIWGGIKLFRE